MNRIKTTTTTTGTGNITVSAGAAARCRPLSDLAPGKQVAMMIEDESGSDWELSLCTILSATTFSRDTVLHSSNGGAKVNFGAGTKTVFATMDANAVDRGSSARVYYLSKMGVPNDADLADGSTTFGADSTAAVQAVLDLASATNPICIVWDVKCSGTGWKLNSGTTIEPVGDCGGILRTGSNKSLFENANIRWTPETRIDKNITIKGGVWNGNRGPRTNGVSGPGANNSKGNGTTGLNCIFRFYGVENLVFEPNLLIASPSYSSHVMNCKRVTSRGVRHDVGAGWIMNNDGHNTGGYCEDIVYRDISLRCYDDPLSISPDDVWGIPTSFVYPFYPVAANGPIKSVLVDNLLLDSIVYGVRLMSGASRLDDVEIRKVTGSTALHAILFDNYQSDNGGQGLTGAAGNGNIGSVTIDGVDVAVTDLTAQGTGAIATIRIKSSIEKLTIKKLRRSYFGNAAPTILVEGAAGVTIGSLEVDGYDSDDLASSQVIPHIKLVGGTVRRLRVQNANVRRAGGVNASKFIELTGGATINAILLDNVILDGITNLIANASGTISLINATNITHLNGGATFQTASPVSRLNCSGYIGTTLTSGTFTTVTGDAQATAAPTQPVQPAQPTVAQMTPIDYPVGDAMVTKDANNVWTTTARDYEPVNGYKVHGRASPVTIAAGQNGFICTQHATALGGIYAVFGLATTYSATAPVAYGVLLYENTTPISIFTNGGGNTNGTPAGIVGNYYGIRRVGTTVTLETSPDGTNWTVLYTWPGTSTTDLYPIFYIAGDAGANLYKPVQNGFA